MKNFNVNPTTVVSAALGYMAAKLILSVGQRAWERGKKYRTKPEAKAS